MNSRGRYAESFGDLIVREAAEKHQLDDVALAFILKGQSIQGFIEIRDNLRRVRPNHQSFIQSYFLAACASFQPVSRLGMFDKDAAQNTGRDGKKVRAILPG